MSKNKLESVQVPCWQIFWTFFRVGLFTLGGGMAMATVLRHELVLKKKWVADETFIDELSTATLIPGAIAVNFAYLQGRNLRGAKGSLAAVLGTILPSICIILFIAYFAVPYFENPKVKAFLKGCSLAVVGQLAFAAFTFGKKHLRRWENVFIAIIALISVAVLKFHPIWAILIAAVLGYFFANIKLFLHEQSSQSN
ncbi:MAG: chromate transporter [Candidatus Cloacimonadales bacterium]